MAAPWYTPTGQPATNSSGSSAVMRTEFQSLETAMDKLGSAAANGIMQWNSDGTAVVAQTQLTLYDDLDFSVANPEILGRDTDGVLYLAANTTAAGAHIRLYGDTHASQPNDFELMAGATVRLHHDHSTNTFDFQANALTTTGLVTAGSLDLGTVTVTDTLDEDNMASNSDVALATQQSIKAYVDAQVAGNTTTIAKLMFMGSM